MIQALCAQENTEHTPHVAMEVPPRRDRWIDLVTNMRHRNNSKLCHCDSGDSMIGAMMQLTLRPFDVLSRTLFHSSRVSPAHG